MNSHNLSQEVCKELLVMFDKCREYSTLETFDNVPVKLISACRIACCKSACFERLSGTSTIVNSV